MKLNKFLDNSSHLSTNKTQTSSGSSSNQASAQDVFQIAAKAEQLKFVPPEPDNQTRAIAQRNLIGQQIKQQ